MSGKEVKRAPSSQTWSFWRQVDDNILLMARKSHDGYLFSPLYMHSFPFAHPHYLTKSEEFVARYPDPSRIEHTWDKLRYYRYKKSLLQKDVAEYIGVDRATYGEYETGLLEFYSPDKLSKLSELLEVSPYDLICDEYTLFLYKGQGQQIRDMRKGMGLTQCQLGQIMGVHGGTIKKWEAENVRLSKKMWKKLVFT